MGWRDYYSMTPNNKSGGYISMFDGYARNYLDPNSTYNTGMRRDFNKQGQDIASNQYRQGMRMQAAGVNPFASEQYRQASGQAREASMGAYNESVRQSQGLGQNMLGMGLQARTQMSQQEQQQKQWDRELRQHDRGQALSLGGTLLGAALMGPVASMFTKPTSIVNNMPEGMGPLATDMYQTSPEAANVQDWVVKNNIDTNALGDITSPEYANARRMFGDSGISAWQDNALSRGVINPSTKTPGWLRETLLKQANATPVETATTTNTVAPTRRYSIPAGELEAYGASYGGNFVNNINSMLESGLPWEEYARQQGWRRGSAQYNQLRNAARQWRW